MPRCQQVHHGYIPSDNDVSAMLAPGNHNRRMDNQSNGYDQE